MKFSKIFNKTILFWPSEIDVSDGEVSGFNGCYFKRLSKIHDAAEDNIEKWSDWHKLMNWAIFCGFHNAALINFRSGKLSVSKKTLIASILQRNSRKIYFQ